MPSPRENLDKINAQYDTIVEDCYKKSKPIVEAKDVLIRQLMPVLVDKKSIFKPECEKILNELGGINKIS